MTLPSAFQTARETWDSRQITNPLPGDPGHRVMRCRYHVDVNHWGDGRLNPPMRLGTAHSAYPDMYCVESDQLESHVGPLVFFTRTFAAIPKSYDDTPSSSVVRLVGIDQAPTWAAAKTITAATPLTSLGGAWLLTSAAHGYSAADRITLNLYATSSSQGGAGGIRHTFTFNAEVTITAVTTDTITVTLGPPPVFFSASWTVVVGSARKATTGFTARPVSNRLVTVRTRRDYFFVGVSAEAPSRNAIPLFQPFAIEYGTADPATFAEHTVGSATVPTATQYRALVDAQADLPIDCILENYLGPIVCRKTTTFTAV